MFRESWLPKGFEFLSGLPERLRKRRALVPMQAFVDESGDDRFLVLAGLSASTEMWANFATDWDHRLRSDPAIRYFKHYEAFHRSGQFRHWRSAAIDKKVSQLVAVLEHHAPMASYVVVALRSYEEVIRRPLRGVGESGRLTSPYVWALSWIIPRICLDVMSSVFRTLRDQAINATSLEEARALVAADPSLARLEVMFDNNDIFRATARQAYGFLRSELSREVLVAPGVNLPDLLPLEPWFRDDVDFLPLQAADLLAGDLRRHLTDHVSGLAASDLLSINIPCGSVELFNRKTLQEIVNDVFALDERFQSFRSEQERCVD